ncbi:hexosaminidase D-like isoform X2 [Plodia interpunctella]|nr:hexosaminidase D-like isoform X2 [Plodia interpunctella]XP_053619441.1 hexosaminidase D-like isoform X2 [Plodia interpunctella]
MKLVVAITFVGLFLYAYSSQKEDQTITWKVKLDNVVVHIDLKNTPLKLSYLTKLLPILKKLGVTGLLIEYEDMFPYIGELAQIKNQDSYRRSELKNFLSVCKNTNIEVIPLVQTFGHMEYVLQFQQFRELREVDDHMDSICPSKLKSLDLIRNMLSQVMLFHKSVAPLKHIHIGCDEVFNINLKVCNECTKRRQSKERIFMEHIRTVTEIVKNISAETTVLIWDDMIRSIYVKHPVHQTAEPVVWNYKKKVMLYHKTLSQYHKIFPNIWIASAFKGADGDESILPNIKYRFLNHYSWLQGIRNYKFGGESNIFNFKGIILTGWSRYAFGRKPVDLLPCSIPSLMLNLILIAKFQTGVCSPKPQYTKDLTVFYSIYLNDSFSKMLDCDMMDIDVNNNYFHFIFDYDNLSLDNCNFTEWKLYKSVKEYIKFYYTVNGTEINSKLRDQYLEKMYELNFTLFHIMNEYYAPNFVNEYVNNLILKIKDLLIKS